MHPYDISYLRNAKASLSRMLDIAVNDLQQDTDEFFDLFISSGTASLFEHGDIRTLAGMSGTELAYAVLERSGMRSEHIALRFNPYKSRESRAGSILAQYQWETSFSFEEISRAIPISRVCEMCSPDFKSSERKSHPGTDDPEQLYSYIKSILDDALRESMRRTRLQSIRVSNGLSQRQLANASGVPIRTIQQYEQRQKDINKAQFEYLVKLAAALNCDPLSLIERHP